MDPMSAYLAKAMIDARLASAQEQRPGRRIEQERREDRRQRRRSAIVTWCQGRTSRGRSAATRTLTVAATPPVRPPSVDLARALDQAAHRVAEHGTSSERRLLEAMAEVAAQSAPGAAAALVDPEGTEASRVRAFGLVHTHLVDVLGPREHEWLLDLLDGGRGTESPGRVA